jgi:hypothetical protein
LMSTVDSVAKTIPRACIASIPAKVVLSWEDANGIGENR